MTVQELIDSLMKVKNKDDIVTVCIYGVEINETIVIEVIQEPDINVVWLKIPNPDILENKND